MDLDYHIIIIEFKIIILNYSIYINKFFIKYFIKISLNKFYC